MNIKNWVIIIIVSLGLIGGIWYFALKNPNAQASTILFTQVGCTHCEKVETFIKDNQVADKFTFEILEIRNNPANNNLFFQKAQACNLPQDQMGTPLLWDNGQCYSGDQAIINFFQEKIK